MIGRLRGVYVGQVLQKSIIDVSGCGYEVSILDRLTHDWVVGQEVTIVVYTYVREDILRLFGFELENERWLFENFMVVPGVGTKVAFALLNFFPLVNLLRIISSKDHTELNQVDGIGPKLAARITSEMHPKAKEFYKKWPMDQSVSDSNSVSSIYKTVFLLLEQLGYQRSKITVVLDKLYLNKDHMSLPADEMVKLALQELS